MHPNASAQGYLCVQSVATALTITACVAAFHIEMHLYTTLLVRAGFRTRYATKAAVGVKPLVHTAAALGTHACGIRCQARQRTIVGQRWSRRGISKCVHHAGVFEVRTNSTLLHGAYSIYERLYHGCSAG